MRVTPVPEPEWVGDREDGAKPKNDAPEPCPICEQAGAQEWLRGPDRLHGRQEQVYAGALPGVFARLAQQSAQACRNAPALHGCVSPTDFGGRPELARTLERPQALR